MGAAARFLAPGEKLGKHDLIRQIAVGGMAELYLARTMGIEGFEKLVVIKRIHPQYAGNASFVNMFLNEARLAATLHHPNIAQVYDIGQDRGEYFFSMEYVHGEDLGNVLRTATDSGVPISLDAALTLVAHLCAGLHHAHEKTAPDGRPLNVVHRDVSPSNVLVSYDGGVKLVDFGIARVQTTPGSVTGGLKGKISYMSPEQCRGKTTLDRRSDVFSVGTILYELTTGQLPFTDETEYAVLNHIVNQDAAPPSTLVESYPKALEAIVMRALARDPEQRFRSAIELQEQIENFAHESRLRVSPLTLARLMSTLFPQRLEEWKNAVTQGAFFVEQHVVRTLIENDRASEQMPAAAAPAEEESTAVSTPPLAPDSAPTRIHQPGKTPVPPRPATIPPPRASTPIPVSRPSPTPAPHRPAPTPAPHRPAPTPAPHRPTAGVGGSRAAPDPGPISLAPAPHRPTPTPPPKAKGGFVYVSTEVGVPTGPTAPSVPSSRIPTPAPNAVPIVVAFEPSQPGKLVSNSGPLQSLIDSGPASLPVEAAPRSMQVGERTEYVRLPPKKRGKLVFAVALVSVLGVAAVTFVVLGRGSSDSVADPSPPAEPPKTAPPPVEPTPKPPVAAEVKPPDPEPPKQDPPKPAEPVVVDPPIETKPDPKPEPPKPAVKQPPRPKTVPKKQPKPKTEPKKEPAWNGNSPFMPVRPDKQ